MPRRNLILIHRGPEYRQDFEEICAKLRLLEPEAVTFRIDYRVAAPLPPDTWRHPTLTVAFTSDFRTRIVRGPVLRNIPIDKLTQARILQSAAVPTPPTQRLQIGAKLDPILFGDFVVIKPLSLELGSLGRGVQLFRRRKLESMSIKDFPRGHLIHKDPSGFLVQRFVDSGDFVSYNRVLTLFGEPMYSYISRARKPRGSLEVPDEVLERRPITNNATGFRERRLAFEDDALELARRVHDAFPDVPLLGTDIVREERSGKVFAIECNAGGNTWHFSSRLNEPLRKIMGQASLVGEKKALETARQMHIDQFNAFDRAAEVLLLKLRSLAS
jgi:hypothetical protein